MKKYKSLITTLSLGLILFSVVIPLTFAQTTSTEGLYEVPKLELKSENIFGPDGILNKALKWIFTALIIVAAIMLVYAGFTYVTAGGDPGKVKTALNQVIYALVGIAIGILAKGLIYLVCNFISGGMTGAQCKYW